MSTISDDIYYKRYLEALNKSLDVFQVGGPLDYLLKPGESCLNDGPMAAVREIARLRSSLKLISEAGTLVDCRGIAKEALRGPK